MMGVQISEKYALSGNKTLTAENGQKSLVTKKPPKSDIFFGKKCSTHNKV